MKDILRPAILSTVERCGMLWKMPHEMSFIKRLFSSQCMSYYNTSPPIVLYHIRNKLKLYSNEYYNYIVLLIANYGLRDPLPYGPYHTALTIRPLPYGPYHTALTIRPLPYANTCAHAHRYLITVAHIAILDNITFISLVIWVQMGL